MFSLHLERIEMSGFKSFADKTVIEFDEGVTAVVGPRLPEIPTAHCPAMPDDDAHSHKMNG
jgi:hypothetical protein